MKYKFKHPSHFLSLFLIAAVQDSWGVHTQSPHPMVAQSHAIPHPSSASLASSPSSSSATSKSSSVSTPKSMKSSSKTVSPPSNSTERLQDQQHQHQQQQQKQSQPPPSYYSVCPSPSKSVVVTSAHLPASEVTKQHSSQPFPNSMSSNSLSSVISDTSSAPSLAPSGKDKKDVLIYYIYFCL